MDESFPLPGRGAELNWKLLFIPLVSRRRIRFVCNWFKPGGSFVEERLRFFLLMEKMIEFVLSRVPPLRLLSFLSVACVSKSDHLSPLSTRAPCWAVKVNLQTCSLIFYPFPLCLFLTLPLLLSFFFFFLPTTFEKSSQTSSSSSFRKKRTWKLAVSLALAGFDEMMNPVSSRWCLTPSQQSPATPSRDRVRSLVKGSLSTGFPL